MIDALHNTFLALKSANDIPHFRNQLIDAIDQTLASIFSKYFVRLSSALKTKRITKSDLVWRVVLDRFDFVCEIFVPTNKVEPFLHEKLSDNISIPELGEALAKLRELLIFEIFIATLSGEDVKMNERQIATAVKEGNSTTNNAETSTSNNVTDPVKDLKLSLKVPMIELSASNFVEVVNQNDIDGSLSSFDDMDVTTPPDTKRRKTEKNNNSTSVNGDESKNSTTRKNDSTNPFQIKYSDPIIYASGSTSTNAAKSEHFLVAHLTFKLPSSRKITGVNLATPSSLSLIKTRAAKEEITDDKLTLTKLFPQSVGLAAQYRQVPVLSYFP